MWIKKGLVKLILIFLMNSKFCLIRYLPANPDIFNSFMTEAFII